MQNLIEFLARNGVFLIFIGLEVLCFNLVINNNQNQAEIYHNTSSRFTAAMQKRVSEAFDFLDLRRINDSLRVENASLREDLINRIARTPSVDEIITYSGDRYSVIPTNVIQNSIGLRNNYITLDRGRDSGIRKGMGVVDSKGPIGIVVAATPKFAKVMSLLHSNSMISASIRSKGYFGSLVWKSADPRIMELDAVPKHAPLAIGDTVITSGYSKLFPPDLIIGRIDTFWLPRGSNFYRARVALEVEMADLHNAYVIDDRAQIQLDSLENSGNYE